MNDMYQNLTEPHASTPLHQGDVAHDVSTLLRAVILICSLLLFSVLAAAAVEFLYTWAQVH